MDARTLAPGHALGRKGEDAAHRYLQGLGYRVVGRNWRSKDGKKELDLIAWQRGEPDRLVIVEVKSRRTDEGGAPERNVDRAKLRGMKWGASEYCRQNRVEERLVRFDVISVVFEPEMRIEH
ncbi:MAG: YraN family protein, partial [Microbacteriaceae bacterium]|nr:YraN family protein [Microbacteriaceae bacterium]